MIRTFDALSKNIGESQPIETTVSSICAMISLYMQHGA
eukprot:COSAG01_NODE_20705_length_939_cov_1.408333_1_plen_37_part_10